MADNCRCAFGPISLRSNVSSSRRRSQTLTIIARAFASQRSFAGNAPAGFGGCENDDSQQSPRENSQGFSLLEILATLAIGSILAAMAIPTINGAMTSMRLSSTVTALSSAISNTRYRAIKDSQVYTLVVTTPGNTYVATNVATATADSAVPLPNPKIALNGGGTGTFTFTLCPNGTVYGAGGTCPGSNTPPAVAATYLGKETDISVSSSGNVTATKIH